MRVWASLAWADRIASTCSFRTAISSGFRADASLTELAPARVASPNAPPSGGQCCCVGCVLACGGDPRLLGGFHLVSPCICGCARAGCCSRVRFASAAWV